MIDPCAPTTLTIGSLAARLEASPDGHRWRAGDQSVLIRIHDDHVTVATDGPGDTHGLVRAATRWAVEWLPGRVIHADPTVAEQALAAAGFGAAGVLPRLALEEPSESLREDMLAVWCRVNDAGGAVGFLPRTPRPAVAEVLDRELARTDANDAPLVALREDDGSLLGFCWWVRDPFHLFRHSVVLKRLMIDPVAQGRGLGSILLVGAHAVARELPGVDLLRLDYRSGYGLGDFYAGHGWVETGRVPGLIRVAPGDDRDSVSMARHPRGLALSPEGRT